jgi:hypothetical protein
VEFLAAIVRVGIVRVGIRVGSFAACSRMQYHSLPSPLAGYVRGLPYVNKIWSGRQDELRNGVFDGKYDLMQSAAMGITDDQWEEGVRLMISCDPGLKITPMKSLLLRAFVRLQKPLIARGDDLRGVRKAFIFMKNLPGVRA